MKSPRRHTVDQTAARKREDFEGIKKFKRRFRKFFQESSNKTPETEEVFTFELSSGLKSHPKKNLKNHQKT